uniref:Fibrinogen C-terminal domain-containing protein n=1 Tax=Caenorhabditis tropicalis TaxID=1561998 RepID=A0A1I7T7T7_9PELO
MTCALNGRIGNTRTVGIAGFKKGATREQYEILAQGYMEVVETLVCDPSTGYFHIEKSSSEYETFWCAFRNYGNDWWIDLPEP